MKRKTNKNFISVILSFPSTNNKKKRVALLKGPGNQSKYRLSFTFFCVWRVAKRKKNSADLNSIQYSNKKYTRILMGGNLQHGARFFPPKDLVYFSIKTRHNSKAQTFFFHGQFSRQKTQNFLQTFLVSQLFY